MNTTTHRAFAAGLALAGMAFLAPAVSGFQSFGTDFDGALSGRMATFAAASQGKSLDIDFGEIKASAMLDTAKAGFRMAEKAAKEGDPEAGNAYLQTARIVFQYIKAEVERVEPNTERMGTAGALLAQSLLLAEENGANHGKVGQLWHDYLIYMFQNTDFSAMDDETRESTLTGILMMMQKAADLGNADAKEFLEHLDDED